jgi:hypothetical protein
MLHSVGRYLPLRMAHSTDSRFLIATSIEKLLLENRPNNEKSAAPPGISIGLATRVQPKQERLCESDRSKSSVHFDVKLAGSVPAESMPALVKICSPATDQFIMLSPCCVEQPVDRPINAADIQKYMRPFLCLFRLRGEQDCTRSLPSRHLSWTTSSTTWQTRRASRT